MGVAILGDRASGKTTFLGLLYAAQVKYGTAHKDIFRFHGPPSSLDIMKAIYEKMKGEGKFPGATLKEQATEVSFLFGYKGPIWQAVGRIYPSLLRRNWVNPFAVINFKTYDVAGEDIQEFIETGKATNKTVEGLFKSSAVVFIIDCSKMSVQKDIKEYKQMLSYDGEIAKLLSGFQEYKKNAQKDYERIAYPVFVFTKFDMIRPDVLQCLGLSPMYPSYRRQKEREEYAETFLRAFLKQGLSQKRGGKLVGVSFDEAGYFFSWTKTEKVEGAQPVSEEGPRIARREIQKGVYEIDFSYEEYEGFIEHFHTIAKKLPDEVKEESQISA